MWMLTWFSKEYIKDWKKEIYRKNKDDSMALTRIKNSWELELFLWDHGLLIDDKIINDTN